MQLAPNINNNLCPRVPITPRTDNNHNLCPRLRFAPINKGEEEMYLIGTTIRKKFNQFNHIGKNIKFDDIKNWYTIEYQDGDWKEIWLVELKCAKRGKYRNSSKNILQLIY